MSGTDDNTADTEELVLTQEVMPDPEASEKASDEAPQSSEVEPDQAAASADTDSDAKGDDSHSPEQSEMPFALVHGQAFTNLPKDLYIPPDALEVILESFAGPLDLLLYLIRKQNIDILEIDVSAITHQYVAYVEMMEAMHFELAAEYLVMAAMLAEIKSRMLLPRSSSEDEEDEEDPRAQLIRRLQEYERFKQAAEDIDSLPRLHRDTQIGKAKGPDRNLTRPDPDIDMRELMLALSDVLRRADMFTSHHVEKEKLSTRERMTQVLDNLRGRQFVPFVSLFTVSEGRLGVVVTFLAVMELIKESLVEMVQTEAFGPIHVKARGDSGGESSDGSEGIEGGSEEEGSLGSENDVTLEGGEQVTDSFEGENIEVDESSRDLEADLAEMLAEEEALEEARSQSLQAESFEDEESEALLRSNSEAETQEVDTQSDSRQEDNVDNPATDVSSPLAPPDNHGDVDPSAERSDVGGSSEFLSTVDESDAMAYTAGEAVLDSAPSEYTAPSEEGATNISIDLSDEAAEAEIPSVIDDQEDVSRSGDESGNVDRENSESQHQDLGSWRRD